MFLTTLNTTAARICSLGCLSVILCALDARAEDSTPAADFAAVLAVFNKHCVSCHGADEPEGGLVLESHASILRGGENGDVIVPGDSDDSRLVRLIERREEPFMPPGKRKRPSADEVALIRAWIDAGARSGTTDGTGEPTVLEVPDVRPVGPPRRPIFSLAFSRDGREIALGRHGVVEVVRSSDRRSVRRFDGLRGDVNAVDYSRDGALLVAAGGEPGRFGEARIWRTDDGSQLRVFRGHRDSVYAVAFTQDGKTLATGSYDQKIRLWNVETGELRHELDAHNGAVFDLAFRHDGKLLASASADRTTKIWNVATGERLETLTANKEVYAVAFSPDGKLLATGGADSRIRVWQVSESAAEGTNPLKVLRFGHEGAIVRLSYSPDGKTLLSTADDRTAKLWSVDTMVERRLLETQPDWPVAARFAPDGAVFAVGCLDGSLHLYGTVSAGRVRVVRDGRRISPTYDGALSFLLAVLVLVQADDQKTAKEDPKPTIEWADPPGVQRGVWSRVRLGGTHLTDILKVIVDPAFGVRLLDQGQDQPDHVWVEVQPPANRPRGPTDLSVETADGKSTIKLFVDDLIQIREQEPNDTVDSATPVVHPASLWGTLQSGGDQDFYRFHADAGQTIVLDLAAKHVGSPANAVVTVFRPDQGLLAASNAFDPDRGANDPLLLVEIPVSGQYTVQVNDHKIDGSRKHFYRLTVGALPYVTGVFPLAVPANSESEVELIGYNLGPNASATVTAGATGETNVSVDATRHRSRRDSYAVLISPWPVISEILESEPNDQPENANSLPVPGSVSARIQSNDPGRMDVDFYRFQSKKGQRWIIETQAQERGFPVDTRIEVLSAAGHRIEKVLLQAVGDTFINFASVSSNMTEIRLSNFEDIHRNEYVYLRGDVCKVRELPRGPDGSFMFYNWKGRRRSFFDTSVTGHANFETGYVVEPHPPGTRLVSNGLPVFAVYQTNDDDGDRRAGKDSRVDFVAPEDGAYSVRVENVLSEGGDRHCYRLTVREARPDFVAWHSELGRAIPRGGAMSFKVHVDRKDAFDGAVRFDLDGVPDGYTISSPVVIQEGQDVAIGTLHASMEAEEYGEDVWSKLTITASGVVADRRVEKKIGAPKKIGLGAKPQVMVKLLPVEPYGQSVVSASHVAEMTVKPGETIRALLRVERNGHEAEIGCSVENLPFGVIVDNIGLSGVRVLEGESEREVFISCGVGTPETSRLCHAQAAGQYSLSVMLHVRN